MNRFFMFLLAICLLAGCSAKEPLIKYEMIEVKVPIQVMPEAPTELLEPIIAGPPIFISPADPEASSGLSREGEEKLKRLLLEYYDRELAWRSWSGNPGQ